MEVKKQHIQISREKAKQAKMPKRAKEKPQNSASAAKISKKTTTTKTATIPLADLFKCKTLINKRSIFKILHVKQGRKKHTKVFSAVVADDTAVARLVTFGFLNCQKARSVFLPESYASAKWSKASFDPQEPQYRTYELEKWQIVLDDTTALQHIDSSKLEKPAPTYEKAQKAEMTATLIKDLGNACDFANNSRITFIAELVGGVGMQHPQQNGEYFKILVSNEVSQEMLTIYLFNQEEIRQNFLSNEEKQFKFIQFRISTYHGKKGVVSTDDSIVSIVSADESAAFFLQEDKSDKAQDLLSDIEKVDEDTFLVS